MNKIYNIKLTKKVDLSIYKDKNLYEMMNEYNKETYKNIDLITEYIKKDFFKVPSIKYSYAWGQEKVFYPFTSKLYKVLETSINDTSIQIHPLKTEKYLSLSDNTIITDKANTVRCKKGEVINIPNNTIHSLLKNSRVLEEQDNLIFDNKETVRIEDKLKRKVSEPQEYIKYLLPQFLNHFNIEKLKNYNGRNDKFIYIADGKVEIEYKGIKISLEENEELYYLSKNVKINKIEGLVKIIECEYYKVE